MNNLLSYCGLVVARISASEKDLSVTGQEFFLQRTGSNKKLNFQGLMEDLLMRLNLISFLQQNVGKKEVQLSELVVMTMDILQKTSNYLQTSFYNTY